MSVEVNDLTAVISKPTVAVEFLPDYVTVQVEPGITLLQASRRAGLTVDAPCGEHGKCGKCRVRVTQGADEPGAQEQARLTPAELAAGIRLSCLARVLGPATVEIPETSRHIAQRKATAPLPYAILSAPYTRKCCAQVAKPAIGSDLRDDLSRLRAQVPQLGRAELGAARELHAALLAGDYTVTAVLAGERLIAVEPGDTTLKHYGAAIDIGTTTVAGYLVDLRTGAEVAASSLPNPQAGYGADVISRIEYTSDNAEHLEALRRSVADAINTLLETLAVEAAAAREHIYEMTVVGNTCMSHLFLGIDPLPLGHSPYTPVVTDSLEIAAAELGVRIHPRGVIRTLPNVAGFVGADAVGVLAASNLAGRPNLHVAVDIGTNAEVLASLHGQVIACSAAAGPAFEGARISHGMRAQPGAIDGVTISDDLYIHTIGETPALGICGSGVIDAISELRRAGIIEVAGNFADPDDLPELPAPLRRRLTDDGIVLAWAHESGTGEDIPLTMRDVREVQLVKAAIYAGIATLLEKTGHTPEEIDGLHIAGAFGTYISPAHALNIGLIPNIPLEKVHFLGNAAGAGAKMALISRDEFAAITNAARNIGYVELAGDTTFTDNFMMAMLLAPGCEEE